MRILELESRCTGNRTDGSNPSPPYSPLVFQRNLALRDYRGSDHPDRPAEGRSAKPIASWVNPRSVPMTGKLSLARSCAGRNERLRAKAGFGLETNLLRSQRFALNAHRFRHGRELWFVLGVMLWTWLMMLVNALARLRCVSSSLERPTLRPANGPRTDENIYRALLTPPRLSSAISRLKPTP